jgi:hypothetical protein
VRRRFQTSAWVRSLCSIRKAPGLLDSARSLPSSDAEDAEDAEGVEALAAPEGALELAAEAVSKAPSRPAGAAAAPAGVHLEEVPDVQIPDVQILDVQVLDVQALDVQVLDVQVLDVQVLAAQVLAAQVTAAVRRGGLAANAPSGKSNLSMQPRAPANPGWLKCVR